ncbi:DUF6492 family protein [Blastococcus sp. URHD0036]|uniref:DUF6492 family protein n=1 Tax=Blastococcus sp. URHD0036 TaxID=1380356 RepID=UPI00068D65B8|nr:DUF6492 family protein [Blastococcus sp. URHD0036]
MPADLGVFMCVHARDVDGLFPLALRSLDRHFPDAGSVHVVTNDPDAVQRSLDREPVTVPVRVSADADWLTPAEAALPGWYRQQVLKLRAHRLVDAPFAVNLGADTLLLRDVPRTDLVDGDAAVLRWTRHRLPDVHWRYERARVRAVGDILGTRPEQALRHVDFINDFFPFDRRVLQSLETFMTERYGPEPWATLLAGRGTTPKEQRLFGEWTLYATYVLDVLRQRPPVREASNGYLAQLHSPRAVRGFAWDSAVVHLVPKGLDVERVRTRLDALDAAGERT